MDETPTTQGTPQSGLSSAGEGGNNRPAERMIPESQWRSDVKAAENKRKTELAEALAARDALSKNFEAVSSRLEALEERNREAELETVRKDHDLLKRYQDMEGLRKKVRDLEREGREAAIRLAEADQIKKEYQQAARGRLLQTIASKFNADETMLSELATESVETLEKVAKFVGNKGQLPEAPSAPGFTPDSAISSGGVGEITPEWADKASMEEYAARRRKQDPTIL